jgi:hypothetical protein
MQKGWPVREACPMGGAVSVSGGLKEILFPWSV